MAATAHIDRTFRALSDATRRSIVSHLAAQGAEGCTVTDLAKPLLNTMSLPAVSKHLRVLEKAGLVSQKKEGQVRRCFLRPEPLAAAQDWITFHQTFWEKQLDSLVSMFEEKGK